MFNHTQDIFDIIHRLAYKYSTQHLLLTTMRRQINSFRQLVYQCMQAVTMNPTFIHKSGKYLLHLHASFGLD